MAADRDPVTGRFVRKSSAPIAIPTVPVWALPPSHRWFEDGGFYSSDSQPVLDTNKLE